MVGRSRSALRSGPFYAVIPAGGGPSIENSLCRCVFDLRTRPELVHRRWTGSRSPCDQDEDLAGRRWPSSELSLGLRVWPERWPSVRSLSRQK